MSASHISQPLMALIVIAASFNVTKTQAFAQATFQGLGDLAGRNFSSSAYSVSADGAVVIGISIAASGREAFRWTASGGMIGLGDLPGGIFYSFPRSLTADGSIIVGESSSGAGAAGVSLEAFRWTKAGGIVGLGDLLVGSFTSEATGVSADGSVIVGNGTSFSGGEAFRWTKADGMVGLGGLPGGIINSNALGVSADGFVIVGVGYTASSVQEAFRWTKADGMVGLGFLPDANFSSFAYAVSANGEVVVGEGSATFSLLSTKVEAFRWTTAGGMVGLGDLSGGGFNSVAYAASADGSVVVGQGRSATGDEAFLWNANAGMRSLKDVLITDFGLDLTGWTLTSANGVSADGLTIAGSGFDPAGFLEAWIATIPHQPSCPGDIDGDGSIGVSDLSTLIGFWSTTEQTVDLNSDGVVNVFDLAQLVGSWGPCS